MTWCPSQAGVYTASAILLFASALAVILRLKARRMRDLSWGWDDYTIIFALVVVWALGFINVAGAARGSLGTHTDLDATGKIVHTWHEDDVSMLGAIAQIIVVVADGVVKCSLLLMYRRIFVGKIFNIVSMTMLVLVSMWTIGFFFATIFECGANPAWTWAGLQSNHEHCEKLAAIWLGHAVSDVATDLIIMAIPIPTIIKLHMDRQNKIALLAIFSLGLIAIAAGTTRLVYVATDQFATTPGSRDLRAIKTNVMTWAFVEAAIGIVTACLVTFKPLFKGRSPESLVNSVRSAISLQSCTSCNQPSLDSDTEGLAARPVSIRSKRSAGGAGKNDRAKKEAVPDMLKDARNRA